MENKTNNCIINFADGIHLQGQKRLIQSLKDVKFSGDVIAYNSSSPIKDFPDQNESPWGFKPHMFLEAEKKGYSKILWLDSSIICIRNPKKIFDVIRKNGYFIFSKKVSTIDKWCSDYTLKQIGVTREQMKGVPEIRAHVIGLDLESDIGKEFLKRWTYYSNDKISFRGLPLQHNLRETFHNDNLQISTDPSVLGHRHDQTVASIIVNQLKMHITEKYSVDYVSEVEPKNRPIEYDCVFLQDRAYKNNPIRYINWSNNNKKFANFFYYIYSVIYTTFKRVWLKIWKYYYLTSEQD